MISTESLKEEREEEEKRRRKEGFQVMSALVKTERVQHVQEELTAQKARGEYEFRMIPRGLETDCLPTTASRQRKRESLVSLQPAHQRWSRSLTVSVLPANLFLLDR